MPVFDVRRLTEAPLDISKIRCECKVWNLKQNHRSGGLISFRGVYLQGSAGVDDARFIRWKLEEFYELYRVDGVVLDCRELEYTWGDNLCFPEGNPRKSDLFPMLIVLRAEQQKAYEYAIARPSHRTDLNDALLEMDQALQGMRSLL